MRSPLLGGRPGDHGGCGERSGGARRQPRCQMTARSSLLRRPTPGARPARRTSSVVAALAALAPRLVRLAHHHYPDGLLEITRGGHDLVGEEAERLRLGAVVKEEDDALHAEPRALAEARHDVVRRAAVAARREAPAGPGEAALGQGGAATLFLAYAVGRACSAARVAARMVPMGLTSLKVRLSNPRDRRRAVEEELLVDSGAIFAVVPAPVLRRIGVRTHGKESFSLADGSRVSRSVGTAFFEIGA